MITDVDSPEVIESNWVLGSGYGYAVVEHVPDDGRVTVVLINEDGLALVELKSFHIGLGGVDALHTYTDSLIRHLTHGKGEEIQLAAEGATS